MGWCETGAQTLSLALVTSWHSPKSFKKLEKTLTMGRMEYAIDNIKQNCEELDFRSAQAVMVQVVVSSLKLHRKSWFFHG